MTSADPGSNGNPVVRSVHLERSSFDITVVGTADPQPTKFEPLPTRLTTEPTDAVAASCSAIKLLLAEHLKLLWLYLPEEFVNAKLT
jgi:hypothetical protein